MEKISMVDPLGKDEQQAIFKMIDLAGLFKIHIFHLHKVSNLVQALHT